MRGYTALLRSGGCSDTEDSSCKEGGVGTSTTGHGDAGMPPAWPRNKRFFFAAGALAVLGLVLIVGVAPPSKALGWTRTPLLQLDGDDELVIDYHNDLLIGSKFGKKDDRENRMPLEEAQKLDGEVVGEPEFLPMSPVLYPGERDDADKDILTKLEGLKRDATITLANGTTIPYWQTLQYANRHFRLYVTRFVESRGQKELDKISHDERLRIWTMTGIARKRLLSDAFKNCVLARGNIPAKKQGNPDKGSELSGEIFYEHLEHEYRGSYFQVSPTKGAAAVANGVGINFNSKNVKIVERKMRKFVGLYAHEQSHNMGYSHPDKIPGAMETCTMANWKKSFHVYDLAQAPDFTVGGQ